jgi:hypothetical protein
VLCWNLINNQLHDIIVALIREAILQFHPHKKRHSLQYDQLGAIVHSHLRQQEAYRNSTPPVVGADLHTLGHTLYQYLLSCHPFGPHHHFHPTQRVQLSMLVPHQVI